MWRKFRRKTRNKKTICSFCGTVYYVEEHNNPLASGDNNASSKNNPVDIQISKLEPNDILISDYYKSSPSNSSNRSEQIFVSDNHSYSPYAYKQIDVKPMGLQVELFSLFALSTTNEYLLKLLISKELYVGRLFGSFISSPKELSNDSINQLQKQKLAPYAIFDSNHLHSKLRYPEAENYQLCMDFLSSYHFDTTEDIIAIKQSGGITPKRMFSKEREYVEYSVCNLTTGELRVNPISSLKMVSKNQLDVLRVISTNSVINDIANNISIVLNRYYDYYLSLARTNELTVLFSDKCIGFGGITEDYESGKKNATSWGKYPERILDSDSRCVYFFKEYGMENILDSDLRNAVIAATLGIILKQTSLNDEPRLSIVGVTSADHWHYGSSGFVLGVRLRPNISARKIYKKWI